MNSTFCAACRRAAEYDRSLRSTRTVLARDPPSGAAPAVAVPEGLPAAAQSRRLQEAVSGTGGSGRCKGCLQVASHHPSATTSHAVLSWATADVEGGGGSVMPEDGTRPSMRSTHSTRRIHGDVDGVPIAKRKVLVADVAKAPPQQGRGGRLGEILDAMRGNLRAQGWLGGFEPLSMGCPLLGRRVSRHAVSEWAAVAWDCDGLGFAWECLEGG